MRPLSLWRLIVASMVFACIAVHACADTPPTFALAWGSAGSGNGQFSVPLGIELSPSGDRVYVADSGNDRLQYFTPAGTYQGLWTLRGASSMDDPRGAAVDATGTVFTIEGSGCCVARFDPSGSYAAQWGTCGTGVGEWSFGFALACAPSDHIYVVDHTGNKIVQYTTAGAFVREWGELGAGPGQLDHPTDVDVAPDGSVWVTDEQNNRVQHFTHDGTYLGEFGGAGTGAGQMFLPGALDVDADGNVWVVDTGNTRVQKFTAAGAFVFAFGSYGTDEGQFVYPHGIAVDAERTVYVSDASAVRIQKFVTPTDVAPMTWGAIKALFRK